MHFPNVDSSIIYNCQVMRASVPWQNVKRCDTYIWVDIYVKKKVIWYMMFVYLCVCEMEYYPTMKRTKICH